MISPPECMRRGPWSSLGRTWVESLANGESGSVGSSIAWMKARLLPLGSATRRYQPAETRRGRGAARLFNGIPSRLQRGERALYQVHPAGCMAASLQPEEMLWACCGPPATKVRGAGAARGLRGPPAATPRPQPQRPAPDLQSFGPWRPRGGRRCGGSGPRSRLRWRRGRRPRGGRAAAAAKGPGTGRRWVAAPAWESSAFWLARRWRTLRVCVS